MATAQGVSSKSGLTTFILCLFLGNLGIHRFYVGKIGTGILMLITLGGLGFWTLYDLLSLVCKTFTDKQDRPVEVEKSPNAPRNVVLVIFLLFVLLFGLMFTFIGSAVSAISTVGKNELAALRQGNIEQAYSYTATDFQKNVTIGTFRKFIMNFPQLHENVDSSFTSVEFKDNFASITGTLTMKDGSTTPIEINLIKEDGQWKILEMNIKVNQGSQPAAAATSKPVPGKPAAARPADEESSSNSNSTDEGADTAN